MTCIQNQPEDFATTALAGFSSIYARHVRPVRSGVVRSTATPEGKVAVVVGGGSGHYPAFAGFVGPGLAEAREKAGDLLEDAKDRAGAAFESVKDRFDGEEAAPNPDAAAEAQADDERFA